MWKCACSRIFYFFMGNGEKLLAHRVNPDFCVDMTNIHHMLFPIVPLSITFNDNFVQSSKLSCIIINLFEIILHFIRHYCSFNIYSI